MVQFTPEQVKRAAEYGVTPSMLYYRTKKGWDIEKAITTPKISYSEAGRRSAASQPRWDIKRGGSK